MYQQLAGLHASCHNLSGVKEHCATIPGGRCCGCTLALPDTHIHCCCGNVTALTMAHAMCNVLDSRCAGQACTGPDTCRLQGNRHWHVYFLLLPRTATPCVVTPPVLACRSSQSASLKGSLGCLFSQCNCRQQANTRQELPRHCRQG